MELDFTDRMRSVDILRNIDNAVGSQDQNLINECIKDIKEDGRFKNIPALLELLK